MSVKCEYFAILQFHHFTIFTILPLVILPTCIAKLLSVYATLGNTLNKRYIYISDQSTKTLKDYNLHFLTNNQACLNPANDSALVFTCKVI